MGGIGNLQELSECGQAASALLLSGNNKKEIDLIIYQDGTVYPIEVKKGSAPKDAIKNFSVLSPIEAEPSEEDSFSGTAHLKTATAQAQWYALPPILSRLIRKTGTFPHG